MKKALIFHGISPRFVTGESNAILQLAKTSLSLGYEAIVIGYNPKPDPSLMQIETGDNQFVYLKEIAAPNSLEAVKSIRDVVLTTKSKVEALICLADFHRFNSMLPTLKHDKAFPIIWNGIHDEEPTPVYYLDAFNDCFDHIAGLTKASTKLFKDTGFNSVSYLSYAHNHDVFIPKNFNADEKKQRRRQYGMFHYDKLFFSNFNNIYRKNISNLIAGFAEHVKKYPNNGLLLKTNARSSAGADIHCLINHFNLRSNVSLIDSNFINPIAQEQLADLYQISDFYIQTAFNEGFGTPLAEAHMCGIPVLAPYTGGMKEQEPEIVIESERHIESSNASVGIMYKQLASPLQIAEACDKAMCNPIPSVQSMVAKASEYRKENQQIQLKEAIAQATNSFNKSKQNQKTRRVN